MANSIPWSMKEFFTHIVNYLKGIGHSSAARYYTILGDDVIEHLNENFSNKDKPLWLNLGYWKNANTYPDACYQLTRLLGTAADLKPGITLLDVGFGFGEQDFVFVNDFGVDRIIGVNITEIQVSKALEKVKERNLEHVIHYEVGRAEKTRFSENSIDRVVALECAFHFDTRKNFFKEAFRVLKPGGLLATTDMLPEKTTNFQKIVNKIERHYSHVSVANYYDRFEYEKILKETGFVNVSVKSIREYVYPGMAKYIRTRYEKRVDMLNVFVELTEDDIKNCNGVEIWRDNFGISDYIIAVAEKPLTH